MAISKDLGKKIVGAVVGGATYTPPATWYFGLSSQPIVDGRIPNGAEPDATLGYARKAIPNDLDNFNEPVDTGVDSVAYVTNKQTITMNEITAGDSTKTVQYFFLAESGNNSNTDSSAKAVQMWGAFDRARPLVINSNLIIEPNGAVFKIVNVD